MEPAGRRNEGRTGRGDGDGRGDGTLRDEQGYLNTVGPLCFPRSSSRLAGTRPDLFSLIVARDSN